MPIIEAPTHRRKTVDAEEKNRTEAGTSEEASRPVEQSEPMAAQSAKSEPVSGKTLGYAILAMIAGIAIPLGFYMVKTDQLPLSAMFPSAISEQDLRNLGGELDYYVVQASKAILIRRELESVMTDIEVLGAQGNEDSTAATALEAIHKRKRDDLQEARDVLIATLLTLHDGFKQDPEEVGRLLSERIQTASVARKQQEAATLQLIQETLTSALSETQVSAFIKKVVNDTY